MIFRIRNFILLSGDFAVLYLSLALTLLLRGGSDFLAEFWTLHLIPFSILNLIWIVVFYILDLYSRHHFRLSGYFLQNFVTAMAINTVATVIFFYLIPEFGVTPKTNLAIYLITFSILFLAWRYLAGGLLTHPGTKKSVIFLQPDQMSITLIDTLSKNPASLYRIESVIEALHNNENPYNLEAIVMERNVDLLVVGNVAFRAEHKSLYPLLLKGVSVIDATTFWESHARQIPIDIVDTAWAISSFSEIQKREFEIIKRVADIFISLALGIILSWLFIIVAVFIKLTSKGPILYCQTRAGKSDLPFTLYKFRTMEINAEQSGPQWSTKNDPRVTKFGRILRHSHLDELPQLWNILKGDMSFIGPRPERPNFVKILEENVPFYSLRHLVKPGITGWAQINYRYGASIEDSKRKLAYDLYYIKHRTLFLDLKISLKTLAMLFRGEGR
ncbi:MAG: sugar transferase [Candidatus Uhrbacteria bacterium]|nr:sugar transferase [Candidatus Uhrbacteria bacterium]